MAQQSMTTVVFMMVMLLLMAGHGALAKSSRPRKLMFYTQDIRSGENATSYVITNSTEGYVSVFDQAIYAEMSMSSAQIGRQYGQASNVVKAGVAGAYYLFLIFDMHINTTEYSGTFLLQGAVNSNLPVQTLALVGGTGDFFLAQGYSHTSFVVGSAFVTPATVKYEIHFKS